jgi:soluble lytic murein transglycosylase
MKPGRLLLVLAVAVVAAGTAVVLGETPVDRPAFIDRLEYPLDYGDLVRAHAAHNRLDAALVAAVIYEESRFRPHALSKVGAMGLMQIQPATAETIARRTGGTSFRVSDLYDPDVNIRYGSWYLRQLIDKYGSERLALAAYNAGETTVDSWLRAGKGIAASDVRSYVNGVESTKKVYRHAYGSDLPAN